MMIYYISNYLIIGVLFGLLVTLINQHLSLKDESIKEFTAGESIPEYTMEELTKIVGEDFKIKK